MPDQLTSASIASSAEIQESGGFRIEISPDGLRVSKSKPRHGLLWLSIVYAALFLFVLLAYGLNRTLIFLALLFAGHVYSFLLGCRSLLCTREDFSVISIFPGRQKRTKTYPRAQVEDVIFGAVSFSKYGTNNGLIFRVGDKRVKVLGGLRCIEADLILNELGHLGYKISRDPAMPMMIEMEQSRRKSWLGRWLF